MFFHNQEEWTHAKALAEQHQQDLKIIEEKGDRILELYQLGYSEVEIAMIAAEGGYPIRVSVIKHFLANQ